MNKKKIILITTIIIVVTISTMIILKEFSFKERKNQRSTNEKEIKTEIEKSFSKIMESSNLTSSNPYDYTKNEHYDNIVSLGNNAVEVLKKMYNSKELVGVQAYISALAIQDITKCNLNTKYNLDWSTAEEFYRLWEDNNCGYRD